MEQIFPKNKTIYNLFKNYCLRKTLLTLYGMKAEIFFLLFQKKLKILALTYYGVRMQKFFLKNDEKKYFNFATNKCSFIILYQFFLVVNRCFLSIFNFLNIRNSALYLTLKFSCI